MLLALEYAGMPLDFWGRGTWGAVTMEGRMALRTDRGSGGLRAGIIRL